MSLVKTRIAAALLAALASAQDLAGHSILIFNEPGCDLGKYYMTGQLGGGYPGCTTNSFSDPNFTPTATGDYNVSIQIPAVPDGCNILVRAPSSLDNPGCGVLQGKFDKEQCMQFTIPEPFDLNFCCGDDCTAAESPNGKRSIEEALASAEQADAEKRSPETGPSTSILDAKKSNPFAKRELGKRACSWKPSASSYTQSGAAQKVVSTVNCGNAETCSLTRDVTSEVSTSNSFGASITSEAGFFDIVSVSASFSYDYTYEESHSQSITVSFNVPSGASGYVDFLPTLECSDGHLDGDGCPGPAGQDGSACIPVYLNDGKTPDGISQFVQTS